jgi:isopenicillin N synthase-like dioxygenase
MDNSRDDRIFEQLRAHGFGRISLPVEMTVQLESTLCAGYEFFRMDSEQKLREILPNECGYRPQGIEYSVSQDRPDQIESFSVCGRLSECSLNTALGAVLFRLMMGVYTRLQTIAEDVVIQLATKLSKLPPDSLRGALRRWSRLQLNYSRPRAATSQPIHDLHEDGNLVTIATATAPGLEFLTSSGDYIQPLTHPGEVLVIPGDILWLLSGGEIRPLYHRVRPEPSCDERIACLLFADLDPMRCQPWIPNEINRGVDVGGRVLASVSRFGLKGFSEAEETI